VQAEDGEHGLEVLAEHGADVIITDINMPKLDGFGFHAAHTLDEAKAVERVRGVEAHRATPILVLSTESDAAKKARARDAGATGWIVKPFDAARLVEAIRRVSA